MNTKHIKEAYLRLVEYVLINGEIVEDERGSTTLECTNLIMNISNPNGGILYNPLSKKNIPVGCVWNEERISEYSLQLLSSQNKGFKYTYGERLRFNHGTDQISEVIQRLKECKESRRATAVTWKPDVDFTEEDVPCLILLDFKIRDGKLNTTAVWRSHDIYGAYFPNTHGISSVMRYVAEKTGVKSGSLTTHSISAHIYEHDWDTAKKLINDNKKGFGWI
jgi:thymidylate synthase